MKTTTPLLLSFSLLGLAGCPIADGPAAEPSEATTASFDASTEYVFSGLDDEQAYRITLVAASNLTPDGDGSGVFVDGDANGAADAGASETIALITWVQGAAVSPAKTVPAGTDDPANPSGVFPVAGVVTVSVTGVGNGSVYPVLYTNAGESTFLEIDDAGAPTEDHVVGGQLTVSGSPAALTIAPQDPEDILIGESREYVISGLDNNQAYRVTLVVDANVTRRGDGSGQFIDEDDNGAADAGASQDVALITEVNGVVQAGAKTVPGGDDDPANPSGVFPTAGNLTVLVTGVGEGTIYPVAYVNQGASTFLELGSAWIPSESHTVGGALNVGL